MPHQHEACVRVCLASVPPAKPERRGCAGLHRYASKPVEVNIFKLAFGAAVERLQDAHATAHGPAGNGNRRCLVSVARIDPGHRALP